MTSADRNRWERRHELGSYLTARAALEEPEKVARAAIGIRARAGWTQDELAVHLGIELNEIKQLESGREPVPPEQVERLEAVKRDLEALTDRVTISQAQPLYPSQLPTHEAASPWARRKSTF
jgi:transcriptional regulator with XRE-family HTH domain